MKRRSIALICILSMILSLSSCALISFPDLGYITNEDTTSLSEQDQESVIEDPTSAVEDISTEAQSTTGETSNEVQSTTDESLTEDLSTSSEDDSSEDETTINVPNTPVPSLQELLNSLKNYTVTILTTDDDNYSNTEIYLYDNGKMQFSYPTSGGSTFTDLVVTEADGSRTYYSDCMEITGYDTYFVVKEDSPYFDGVFQFYYNGLSPIDPSNFVLDGNDYVMTNGKINDVAKNILFDQDGKYYDSYYGEYTVVETFKTISISHIDGKISKIVMTSDYIENGYNYATTYTLTFSEIGSTTVTIPTKISELNDDIYRDLFDSTYEGSGSSDDTTTDETASDETTTDETTSDEDTLTEETTLLEGVITDADVTDPVETTKPALGNDVFDETAYVGIPSKGSSNILVIPVQFTNDKFTSAELEKLEIAFMGTNEQTGWYSLKTYYAASSYGALDLNFTIVDPYTVNQTYANFEADYKAYYNTDGNSTDQLDPVELVIDAVLQKYDSTYDYNDFDSNSDTMIDGIYLIYSSPVDSYSDLFWAWTTMSYSPVEFDGLTAGYYVWCGYETFKEPIVPYENSELSIYVNANATTLIHETGHMLGLPDYYDTDTSVGPAGGVGGGDMMDCNVGDHCSASKYLLGWVKPQIGYSAKNGTFEIGALSDSGDCVLVKLANSNGYESNRYLMIDFYTPTGMNTPTAGYAGQPEQACVRIFEVNAQLGIYTYNGYKYYGYTHNNGDTDTKFIKLVEADGNNSIESTKYSEYGKLATMSDYFVDGSSISYKYLASDGTDMTCDISVSIDTTAGKATINITGATK